MILKKAILDLITFLSEKDLGSFGFSTPSIAMKVFKHTFLKPNTLFVHDNRRALAMERESYYGGYVGNFYVGKVKSKVYYLDVNSLYPYVMQNPVPVKLIQVKNNPKIGELKKCIGKYGMVAQVEIDDGNNDYPKRLEGKLCYVRGHYITTLAGPELERAIKSGSIKACLCVGIYELSRLFKGFVEFFYTLRSEYKRQSNQTGNHFCKLIMNSLYGKFGQLGFRWNELNDESLQMYYAMMQTPYPKEYEKGLTKPSIDWTKNKWFALGLKQPIPVRCINGKTQIKFPVGEHYESCPIISAYITSYGRELLRKYIGIASLTNTLYCDTDSLFVNSRGYSNLRKAKVVSKNLLGLLKFEGISNKCEFWGPKDYTFQDKQRLKGIRSDAIQIGENEFMQNRFEGLASILKRGADPYVQIEWTCKLLSRKYTKGIVNKDGSVSNFVIDEFV